ncbi:hypothetical protein O4J55_13500 [Paracoccus sp. PXZ]
MPDRLPVDPDIEFNRSIDVLQSHVFIPALMQIEAAFRMAYEATHERDVVAKIRVGGQFRD